MAKERREYRNVKAMIVKGSISIVSHGHGKLLAEILSDLADQEDIKNWLIILTFNVPEEFDASEHRGLQIKIVRNKSPRGFGANHNAAAAIAKGCLLAIVNPDIRLIERDTLVKFSSMHWSVFKGQLRAPVVLTSDGEKEDSVRRNISLPNLLYRTRKRKSGWEADPSGTAFFWLAGMFLISRRDAFLEIGGFDERFFLYCEDYDLSARWRLSGGSVELTEHIEVVHNARRDSHRSLQHLKWHLRSLLRVWSSRAFWKVTLRRSH